jgi:hypothetical protein
MYFSLKKIVRNVYKLKKIVIFARRYIVMYLSTEDLTKGAFYYNRLIITDFYKTTI